MSEVNKDNKEFEFIKEQVLPKRSKKFRKWFLPFLMTIVMAIIFGLVAALTFCIAEPRLYKLLHKDEPNPFVIPTPRPTETDNDDIDDQDPEDNPDNDGGEVIVDDDDDGQVPEGNIDNPNGQTGQSPNGQEGQDPTVEPNPTIIEKIDADIDDYITMYNDIKRLSDEVGMSILTISSIIDSKDWFGNPIEKRIYTTGVVVGNDGKNIMLLVSLDRVKDASSIKIEINETTFIDAILHDYESELNLAIVTINTADIPIKLLGNIAVARIGESYTLAVGSPLIAMGSPNGYPESIDMGIVTSKGSIISITDYELDLFNTNIAFNKESDGILINYKGEVVGLITRTLKKDLNKDLSTVLGISKVKSYIDRMVSQTPRIYCGVVAENLPQEAMADYNVTRGVYIYEVKKDSPAFNAGLMSGDIILNVGDRIVSNMNNFYSAISEQEPGTQVTFKVKRTSSTSDKEIEIDVVLEDKNQ
ncbi:MAG: serine protease [Clostridiales bacterium]|jgi:S1-C subfamily serine protease|nr:serine protease [Clostridiales bacterium]